MIDRFALIIGAMKSGTTTLFTYLMQHPEICCCSNKEPDFFNREENWAKGLQWYQSLWKYQPDRHRVALEASTGYTKYPEFSSVVDRMKQSRLQFRFVYIMRDPIDRIESHYRHLILKKRVLPETGTDTIPANILDVSRYAAQIAPFIESFGRDQILLLSFEDFRDAPLPQLHRIAKFLDVDSMFEFSQLHQPINPGRVDHPMISTLEKWSWARRMARITPARFKQPVRDLLSHEIQHDVSLTLAQRKYISSELRDDMNQLNETLGFDTSHWSIHDV